MPLHGRLTRRSSAGFSLLEMIVALAILGMTLSVMYRVAGGATRTVAIDEKTVYGVELARSLLAAHAVVPTGGLREQGETDGGFEWEVEASPIALAAELPLAEGQLQSVRVRVSWQDGLRSREVALDSVVAGREPRL